MDTDMYGEGLFEGMSMCDDCDVNPATVRLTHVEHDDSQTFHLCEECARKRGVPIPDGDALIKGLEAIVGGAMSAALGDTHVKVTVKAAPEAKESASAAEAAAAEAESYPDCPNCGMSLSAFRSQGRLGCAECYTSFEEPIGRILVQVHGAGEHKGKRYAVAPARKGGKKDLERLRRELDKAINGERFERAAEIRDAIRGLGQGVR